MMAKRTKEPRRSTPDEGEGKIQVVVTRSTEAIDFDAWAARWVRAAIAIDRAERQLTEAA
jgi:hypothetical protein